MVWYRVIIVSPLSLRDKDRLKDRESLTILRRHDGYPPHCSDDFFAYHTNQCRIGIIELEKRKELGEASINLTNIQESDRGWYNCEVVFLSREFEKEPLKNVSAFRDLVLIK